MRVLIAPDKFAGTLTAPQVCGAIATGWQRARPRDDCAALPLSDGGPGFVEAIAAGTTGHEVHRCVLGPRRTPTQIRIWQTDADRTWWVTSADVIGLHLVAPEQREPATQTSYGIGQLLVAAAAARMSRVVLGLGGSATVDGGTGVWQALGAVATDGAGRPVDLAAGPCVLPTVADLDLGEARRAVAGLTIVAAGDVDNPLLGRTGAAVMFGPQKGADTHQVEALESGLRQLVTRCTAEAEARLPGAGAAGGLGFGLSLLGATRRSGLELVGETVGLRPRCAAADLVITGEGRLDEQSWHGKVVSGVLAAAGDVPVAAVVGDCSVAPLQWRSAGLVDVATAVEATGSQKAALADPAAAVATAAEVLARRFPPPRVPFDGVTP